MHLCSFIRPFYAVTAIFFLTIGSVAGAETLTPDATCPKSIEWLKQNGLKITASEKGRDDRQAFIQRKMVVQASIDNKDGIHSAKEEITAKRNAHLLAQRSLTTYINEIPLAGNRSFDDVAKELMQSGAVGPTKIAKRSDMVLTEYCKEGNKSIALIAANLLGPDGIASMYYDKILSNAKVLKSLEVKATPYQSKPEALDKSYDGLILDATKALFKPALINRIFSASGGVLYDPLKLSQEVLKKGGSGGYSDSVSEARMMLSVNGATNPLVITAEGVQDGTDLKVSDKDANLIALAEAAHGFLKKGQIVFVVK